jgi:hypothetical protein
VEGLIALVLLVAVGRLGFAFVAGSAAPKGLLTTALELIVALLIIGHMTASLFFPPLRQRVRRHVAQRATILVRAAVERMQTALREQVEAADRLASEGDGLLRLIDGIVAALMADRCDGEDVDRLFGIQPQQVRPDEKAPRPSAPAMVESGMTGPRRPSFD